MLCRKPYKKGIQSYGCGQCMPCRINRRRQWIARMMVEAAEHPYSCFVTLTYNEEHVPKDGSVDKRAVQLFMKRLRQEFEPRKIKFFAVGEYGDQSWRPHYHLMLFGISPTEGLRINKCWPFGFTMTGTAEAHSMSYVTGYVTKKMTNAKDRRLQGRKPEFCLMSLRPGLGNGFVVRVAEAYDSERGIAALAQEGWISGQLRFGSKLYPMPTYIRNKVVEELGLSKEQKQQILAIQHLEQYADEITKSHKEVDALYKSKVGAQAGKSSITRGGKL